MDESEFLAYFAPLIFKTTFEGTHATVKEPKLISINFENMTVRALLYIFNKTAILLYVFPFIVIYLEKNIYFCSKNSKA